MPVCLPFMRRRVRAIATACALALTGLMAAPAWAGEFLIGTGVYDITGPAAETGMFGYAAQQEVNGLHQRLRARAFIMQGAQGGPRAVFVNADLGAAHESLKLAVIQRLQARYGALYRHDNVMLSATHTHVGSGGHAHHTLYILAAADKSGAGYDAQSFEAAVSGIVAAIERAHRNLAPGRIELVEGNLLGATRNRSLPAFRANPDAAALGHDTNKTMTVLKFRKDNGREVGMLNWYAIHPTSFSMKFTHISGDNKGYASQFFERRKGVNYSASETFVAAFANADEGDVVPTDGNAYSAPGYEGSPNEYANAEAAGQRQLHKAWELYTTPGRILPGVVDLRHQWVTMPGLAVAPAYSQPGGAVLCTAARGVSFAAGGENGPSNIPGITEGMTTSSAQLGTALQTFASSPLGGLVQTAFFGISSVVSDPCQSPKPTLLPTGALDWVPSVLPIQVIQVGALAIVGLPFEPTTMVGHRLRAQVRQQLAAKGVDTVVVAGLSNSYAGYLTTREEFEMQHYEGASNEFGPWALGAVQQTVAHLTQAMVSGAAVEPGLPPRDRTSALRLTRPGVAFDDKPLRESFGKVLQDALPAYQAGQVVKASFRSGHPKNHLQTQDSFLRVERWQDGQWVAVAQDWDWETSYQWRREGIAYSVVDVVWRIPAGTPVGSYRLRHDGHWKNGWTGAINPYTGVSRAFRVD
ncbi:neutral/alkaline non-lysosomal ceramidase N-terminal domain-containing protein [Aquabacterium sp. G14]|uniref:neutral/alkaline non-lysosomal ceramidase N-terminal domain-containing protein n=1 Tax=Aquabacterium sp. G14 TaxID=3130164 RepID=UPI0030D8F137